MIVGDQVRLEVLLPEADAEHPVVGVAVDVDGSAQVIGGPAVRLVDGDLLLVSVYIGYSFCLMKSKSNKSTMLTLSEASGHELKLS